jgi:hypothetical protein
MFSHLLRITDVLAHCKIAPKVTPRLKDAKHLMYGSIAHNTWEFKKLHQIYSPQAGLCPLMGPQVPLRLSVVSKEDINTDPAGDLISSRVHVIAQSQRRRYRIQ